LLEYKHIPLPAALEKLPRLTFRRKHAPSAPAPTDKRARVSLADCIVGIAVQTVLGALFLARPNVFAAYCQSGNATVAVPLLNLDAWGVLLPLLLLGLLAGILSDALGLVFRFYCRALFLCRLLCIAAQAVCAVLLLKVLPLWNPELPAQLQQVCPNATLWLAGTWDAPAVSSAILALILLLLSVDAAVNLVRTLRRVPAEGT
jgi:hypothetical protein